jgi:predicted nuclease of restriction endonuclease-like (RecB) superfamily
MKSEVKILDDKKVGQVIPEDYAPVLETIVSKIKAAQARAISAINFELVTVYRDIGQIIHEKQSTVEWGASVVEQLAADLRNLFPKTKGFSSRNLWIMRDLYISYRDHEKLQTLSAEISWSHNVAILSKCQDRLEREFYIRMSKRNGWYNGPQNLDHILN